MLSILLQKTRHRLVDQKGTKEIEKGEEKKRWQRKRRKNQERENDEEL